MRKTESNSLVMLGFVKTSAGRDLEPSRKNIFSHLKLIRICSYLETCRRSDKRSILFSDFSKSCIHLVLLEYDESQSLGALKVASDILDVRLRASQQR